MENDHGIENLLYMDGVVIEVDTELGYFVQFKVNQVAATEERPHGVSYSLTLHDKDNERLMGFDNAHAIKDSRRGKYSRHRKIVKWDHKHPYREVSEVTPYHYRDAEKLMVDFWAAVDDAIKLEKARGK